VIARGLAGLAALTAVLMGAGRPPHRGADHGARAAADSFPHARHARLFTTCASCHAGIATGDTAHFLPTPESCASCHNGELVRHVDWAPAPRRITNVVLDHARHLALFARTGVAQETACQRCHAPADSVGFMSVGRAAPDRCVRCHGRGAPSHLAQRTCEPCHTPLHDAPAISVAAIQAYSKPPSHDSTWTLNHGTDAAGPTCAVCHAQQFCASCHVNADRVEAIRGLAPDDRVATMAAAQAVTYPRPPSHLAAAWPRQHGVTARAGVAECANCHTRESCLGCHRVEERVTPVLALPRRSRGGAAGVDLAGLKPADHLPDQLLRHRTVAAGGTASCNVCHRPAYCASCHDAARSPGFHGPDFVARHAQQAYAAETECAACHQTQVFCRSCHRMLGESDTGAPFGKFHNKQPGWLFGHGGVARRAIETCAGCHAQNFCLRCHSAIGGQGVSPHGNRFDPAVESKNPATCRLCHGSSIPSR
jgi:predicted CXXCH cytochrome family protein